MLYKAIIILIVVGFGSPLLSQVMPQYRVIDGKIYDQTDDRLAFLNYYNNETNQGLSPKFLKEGLEILGFYDIVMDFIASHWIGTELKKFFSNRTKKDDLAQSLGYMILQKAESGEIELDLTYSEWIKLIE